MLVIFILLLCTFVHGASTRLGAAEAQERRDIENAIKELQLESKSAKKATKKIDEEAPAEPVTKAAAKHAVAGKTTKAATAAPADEIDEEAPAEPATKAAAKHAVAGKATKAATANRTETSNTTAPNQTVVTLLAHVSVADFSRYFREWRVQRQNHGAPSGLLAACIYDVTLLCPSDQPSNPYVFETSECLTKNKEHLSPSCLAFHQGRLACIQGLKVTHFCEGKELLHQCLGRFKKSFKRGAILAPSCTESQFYATIP